MEKGEGGGDLNFPPKKTQTEATAAAVPTTATDFPAAKKLARQLDFNSVSGSASVTASTVVLPEHPQRLVVAQMQQPPSSPSQRKLLPPPPQQPQPQPQPHPIPLMPSMQLSHSATTHQQPPIRPVKAESPKARPRQNVEIKDGTPKKQKQCNCKHSRCLKLSVNKETLQQFVLPTMGHKCLLIVLAICLMLENQKFSFLHNYYQI